MNRERGGEREIGLGTEQEQEQEEIEGPITICRPSEIIITLWNNRDSRFWRIAIRL
jgi:hypothetical protein